MSAQPDNYIDAKVDADDRQKALFEYLLRLGDNCLILGQRLAQWAGHAPILEEDLALSNVALDLIGQARMWLTLAGQIEGRGRDEDALAYLRDAGEFRNVLLVEQDNGDFAMTMARQFFFDAWHQPMLGALTQSKESRIADIAAKSVKEVAYHLDRSSQWIIRLGDGTEESHRRMQTAIDDLWCYTGELFEIDDLDRALMADAIGADLQALHQPWLVQVRQVIARATLTMPESTWMQRGGKRGLHSEQLGFVLAEMQFLQRAYPGLRW